MIPVTKLRTVVSSTPHESTLLRLATTWCVLAAGKVQPATSFGQPFSNVLIAMATDNLMMKILLGASVKITWLNDSR